MSPNIVTGSLKEKRIKHTKETGNILPGSSSYIIKVNLIRRSPGSSYKTKYATYLGHMWSQPAIRLVSSTTYSKRTMNCLSTCRSDGYLDNISWHRWRFQTLAKATMGRLCCSLWRLALTLARGLHGLKTEARTRPVPEIVWPDPTRPERHS